MQFFLKLGAVPDEITVTYSIHDHSEVTHSVVSHLIPQSGVAALHSACYFGRKEVVELLLESGADKEARNEVCDHFMTAIFCWQLI